MDSTPGQRLFSRRTRTALPMASHLLQPKVIPDVHLNLRQRQNKQALSFNRGAKELQPLKDGDLVRVRPLPGHSKWFKAQVRSQEAPRSYQVRTEDGRLYRRNRSHLYKVAENFQAMPDGDVGESKVNAQTLLPPGNLLRRHSRCHLNLQRCSYQMFRSQIYSRLRQVFPPLPLLEVAGLLGFHHLGIQCKGFSNSSEQ